MLWHHNTRVNSHQRWKQTRFRICFHLWCKLTNTTNVTEWQVSWNSYKVFALKNGTEHCSKNSQYACIFGTVQICELQCTHTASSLFLTCIKTRACLVTICNFQGFFFLIRFSGIFPMNWERELKYFRFIVSYPDIFIATRVTYLEASLDHEFHETCHSVTSHCTGLFTPRWKQTRNRVCFHLWCE